MRQATVLYAAGVGAPILAVVLTRFAGPAESGAAMPAPPPAAITLPEHARVHAETEPALRRALDRARELETAGPSVSPFPYTAPDPQAIAQSSDTPGDDLGTPRPQPASRVEYPAIQISAILSLRQGACAVIDNRLRREGDTLSPGWTLLSIDPGDRRIVLRHASGERREYWLSVP